MFQQSYHYNKSKPSQSLSTISTKKRKIILLGDSHLRGCLEKLANLLGNSCSVVGITKPNASLSAITSSINLKTEKLTKNYVVIVCGGTRDVAKNETNSGLRHLPQFASRSKNTNVIILCVPHCFDLQSFSCVNKEVVSFNSNIHKIMKVYDHIQICSMSNTRDYYTAQGFHINTLGKNWITNVFAKIIKTLFTTSLRMPAISLPWNSVKIDEKFMLNVDNCFANSTESYPSLREQDATKDWKVHHSTHIIPHSLSSEDVCSPVLNQRPLSKKKPTIRNKDFLWA
jgi:hypothetical protein